MVFASATFIFIFLPITFILYFLFPNKFKNFILLLASLVFYSWGGLRYTIILLSSIVFNYFIAIMIGSRPALKYKGLRKFYLIIAIMFNIGVLFFYKYFNFFVDNVNIIFSIVNVKQLEVTKIVLPVGISFFTFQILSYIIDVYRNEVNVQKNIIKLALYIALFPQLIAGPIVRYIDIENMMSSRNIDIHSIRLGIERFIIGLGKKVILADTMGKMADNYFNNLDNISTPMAWLMGITYSLQIYYDFSAYSDMAIGLGKVFGFEFLENFNYPYISKNIKEFWRRWHISLSTWFRDYLYIPLGGNRKGALKTYRNLLIVFFVTGLWHGASWTFVFWGLYHGMFLLIEKKTKIDDFFENRRFIARIYTLVVVMIGWIFFRADTINKAFHIIINLFNFNFTNYRFVFSEAKFSNILFLLLAIFFLKPRYKSFINFINSIKSYNEKVFYRVLCVYDLLLILLFVVEICFVTSTDFNPFIYFRF
ncbi:hypothetical protein HMPREF9628_01528 [Peptoanaerobacter stomatis]|uniref:Membrane-bound O-acyltransferase family MBOAT n=1 Tax=Peptoanaerobacter stomatis TaxID=796937 RepID=G9XCF1_9FIRM|nr:hypothetical protein HMPREF9628_01528 [Peptoanaerobacter stomatis]